MTRIRAARARLSAWIERDLIRAYLVAMGTSHAAIGATWVLIPSRGRELGIAWVPGVAPPLVGILWLITGAVAAAAGIGACKRAGFVLLQIVPLVIGAFFLVSWALSLVPEHVLPGGSRTAIVTTISYWALWASHALVALMAADFQRARQIVADLRARLHGEEHE